ncbi:TPA: hypothetical protein NH770_005111 [Pseudomonas aeruginosa]|nr:hypothetical protein [Pseudomonas aeruginosa]HBO4175256.1 hypothetical protein [Pseudomonas aeruginosa]HCF1083854.1 hypothetical protein [Pseudomonas aeruginosa]
MSQKTQQDSLPIAEAERPELWAVHAQGPDELYAAFTREDADKHAADLNALPMPEGITVGAVVVSSPWPAAEHWQYLAEQERDHKNEIAVRLRQFERICEGLPQDAIDGGWTVQGIRGYAKRLEDQLKVAQAEVEALRAELQSQRERNTELIFKLGSATNGWGRCEKERDAAQARVAELERKLRNEENAHTTTIEQRDNAEHWADQLANAIAERVGVDIGEHSNLNCPWNEALVWMQQPPAQARVAALTATRNRYGVDAHYFNKNLQRILRDFESFTPDELARSLIILAKVADEKVVAQAQHSVPETINEEANSFLRIADAGQFKDNAVAVRTAAVIIRGLLHRPALMQSIIRHRIGLTPEYEGQWHADLYGEDGEVQHHAEADTPDEAVRAVVALAAAPGKEAGHE